MLSHSQNRIIGQQIGNYRLLSWLGQGNFADVYLGEHIHLKTQAAVKILKASLPDEERENFLNEARTVARLDHPHIVRLLECGIDDALSFLIMSYATNGTLRQRYPHGTPLAPNQALQYVVQAASALHYAHQQKLIHRDVKPENMLLDANSQLLLSDFGLVSVCQSTKSQVTGETAGTAPYMAPEQFQGKARFASDQYALGIVTYEWLCGECPFDGTFAEIAGQHMFVPPPPLREKVPTLSEEVEQVVLCALSKDPAQRFVDVEAFAQALADAIEGKSLVSVALHESVLLHAGLQERTPSLPIGNTPALPAMQQEVETPRDTSNQQENTDIPCSAELPSPVLAKKRTVSTSSFSSPTSSVSLPKIRPYKHGRWRITLLLMGLLIFITGSASLGYMILSGGLIPGKPGPFSRPGTHNISTGTPGRTGQALKPTAEVTATPDTATPNNGKTSLTPQSTLTPTPPSSPDCILVTPPSLTFIGQHPFPQRLTVKNCGNAPHPLDYKKSVNWISVSSPGGTINPDSSATVTIAVPSIGETGFPANGASGSVTFSLGGSQQIILVTYN